MNSCVFQPPNSQLLSEDVIGGVELRAKQTERYAIANIPQSNEQKRWSPQPRSIPSPSTKRKRKQQWPKSPSKATLGRNAAIVGRMLTEQQRLRELRRQRQIRYRKKKDDYANSLEEETRELREEIEKLEQRRRSVSSAIPAKENVWSVATEYFRLFRYGLKASTTSEPSAQQDFVRNSMAPDVVLNAGRGPEAMMRSWKCLSHWFEDVELELEGLHKTSVNSVVAATTTSVTITERTLRNVFPHLAKDDKRREKLLNQRLTMRGSIHFEWDAAYCRVATVLTQANLLTPVLRLLGNLKDSSYVLEKALISPDFRWRLTKA